MVDPTNLGNSSVYLKVLGRTKSPAGKPVGQAMPPGAPLTAAQKQLLKDWICSGAKM